MTQSSKHTIFVEATALSRQQRTGVDYLAEGLISTLVKNCPDTDFVLFYFKENDSKLRISGKNVREIIIDRISSKLYRILLLAGMAPSVEWLTREKQIDKVIFPNFYAWPIRTPASKIFPLVPDTVFLDYPEYVPHWYHRKLLETGVRNNTKIADTILTCSEASRKSISQHFKVPLEQIAVLYPGYELPKKVNKQKVNTYQGSVLFVGTLEPRKNIVNLIKGYRLLSAELKAKHPLILAGGKGWLDEDIQAEIDSSAKAKESIKVLGYVDDQTKTQLYESAKVFAYPVLYEGFGMPIIEAQAHGVPVLTCNNSSLPEAAGESAIYTLTDPESIAIGLKKILTDKKLANKIASGGQKHAANFTWTKSAKSLQVILDIE